MIFKLQHSLHKGSDLLGYYAKLEPHLHKLCARFAYDKREPVVLWVVIKGPLI